MTEKTLQDASSNKDPMTAAKIVSIMETHDSELELSTFYDHFEGFSEDEVNAIVHNLLLSAVEVIKNSIEIIKKIDETRSVSINKGSLYDDVVFECGVYVSGDNVIYTNASFGQRCDKTATYIEGMEHIIEAILLIVEQMDNGERIPKPKD